MPGDDDSPNGGGWLHVPKPVQWAFAAILLLIGGSVAAKIQFGCDDGFTFDVNPSKLFIDCKAPSPPPDNRSPPAPNGDGPDTPLPATGEDPPVEPDPPVTPPVGPAIVDPVPDPNLPGPAMRADTCASLGRVELDAQSYPTQNFAWEMNCFPTLRPPSGWAYYETEDGVASGATHLTRFHENDWPRIEELATGAVLVTTLPKTLRYRPDNNARATDYPINTCFTKLEHRSYFYDRQTPRRSQGWIALQQVDCPPE